VALKRYVKYEELLEEYLKLWTRNGQMKISDAARSCLILLLLEQEIGRASYLHTNLIDLK